MVLFLFALLAFLAFLLIFAIFCFFRFFSLFLLLCFWLLQFCLLFASPASFTSSYASYAFSAFLASFAPLPFLLIFLLSLYSFALKVVLHRLIPLLYRSLYFSLFGQLSTCNLAFRNIRTNLNFILLIGCFQFETHALQDLLFRPFYLFLINFANTTLSFLQSFAFSLYRSVLLYFFPCTTIF